MPDGFSFRVNFSDTDEMWRFNSRACDAADFRAAYEAVIAAAAGRAETEIRDLLFAELWSRDIDLEPHLVGSLAACVVADDDANVAIGDWGEFDTPVEPVRTIHLLIGKVIGRVLTRHFGEDAVREMNREIMRGAVTSSRILSRLVRRDAPGPDRYVPEAGQEPSPAEVIIDPDLSERMPWLMTPLPEIPGRRRRRSAERTTSLEIGLKEDDGTVVVFYSAGRVGVLSATDSEAYLWHIRSARAQNKVIAAVASLRIVGPAQLRATVSLGPAAWPTLARPER
jgi:hypothetical protein